MKILVTDIFNRKSFDIVNILLASNDISDLIFTCGSANLLNKLKSNIIYGKAGLCLLRNGKNFDKDLNKIVKKYKNEKICYLPIEESTTAFFIDFLNSENDSENFIYLLPDKETFKLSKDKKLLNEFCEREQIPCPKYIEKQQFLNGSFGFPIIIKPKEGSGSKGIIFVNNNDDLSDIEVNFDTCFVQERLPNSVNVQAGFYLCKNGKIISYYGHQRIRTYPRKGGVTVLSKLEYSEEIKKCGEKIISKLNWSGLLMIEFIFDERDNSFKLIEINPRLWGSILLSKFSNANFIEKYIDLSNNSEFESEEINKDVFIRWVFPYDFLNWIKEKRSSPEFVERKSKTCYINFTYSTYFRSFSFILLTYFKLDKIKNLFK